MIVYKKGEQVVLTAKARNDLSWSAFLQRCNVPLDYVFTICDTSNTHVCEKFGGMSYLINPFGGAYWNIYTDDIEYAYKVVDLDEDDADCI